MLRRRVGRATGEADQAADGGEVDDHASPAPAHVPCGRLAAVERAAQVDGDHVVPLVGGHRVDVADLADAGAVHEDVDPALVRDQAADGALDTRRRAHIADKRHLARAVEAEDPRALAREALGDRETDPACRTGHQRDPLLQHPAHRARTLTR